MEIILSNNRENPSLRFKNFMFNMKTKGKMSAAFVCTTPGCYASIKGCLFHFGQTLFKNLIKIGLKQEYLDKRVFCLALIPLPSVDAECIELQHLIQDIGVRYPNIGIAKAERFWQYFINTFFEGQFPLRMWNHFDNIYERTNNHVEGDNNKMKLFCGAANPNVDKAVHLLQQYGTTSSDKKKPKN